MDTQKPLATFAPTALLTYVPYLTGLVYFFGFVIFGSYLSTYGIYEVKLLSFEYLKAGILFWVVNAPIMGIIFFVIKEPTDDFSKGKRNLLTAFVVTGTYMVAVSQLLFDRPKLFSSSAGRLCFIIYGILTLLGTSWAARHWPKWIVLLLAIFPFLSYYFYVLLEGYEAPFALLNVQIFFFVVALFQYIDYGDKKLNPFSVAMCTLVLLGIAVTFGSFCIKAVPVRLGGQETRNKILLFNDDVKKNLQNTPIKDSLDGNKTRPLAIVYESEGAYFIHLSDSSTIGINKSLFFGEVHPKQ